MCSSLLTISCLLLVDICFVFTYSQVTAPAVRQCWVCSSEGPHGAPNPLCSASDTVHPRAYRGPCLGLCFTRTDESDPTLVYRGCSSGQWGLPDPLLTQGCYTWQGRSQLWCFCATDGCNGVPIGQAGNVTLESYAQEQREKGDSGGEEENRSNGTHGLLPPSFLSGTEPEVLQCWQCLSHYQGVSYSQCPLHDQVDVTTAYIGNCTGRCFSYTFRDSSGIEVIHRGCSSDQWGLPDPLPTQGCFSWQGRSQLWCFCATHGCNGVKMERHRPGVNRNRSREQVRRATRPWRSFVEKEKRKHTDEQSPDTVLPPYLVTVMYRGCSSSVYGLPDPLPTDGCYSWHGQVWCVCNVTGCNGVRLGVPQTEFDAHISNKGHFTSNSVILIIVFVLMNLFF